MFSSFAIHHASRIAQIPSPIQQDQAFTQFVHAMQFTFAIIGLIAAAVYFWADRKDQKEIDAILRKHGIKK